MTYWAKRAKNHAQADKRKAAKQGVAVAEYLRRINGTNGQGKDTFSPNGSMEKAPDGDDQESRKPV